MYYLYIPIQSSSGKSIITKVNHNTADHPVQHLELFNLVVCARHLLIKLKDGFFCFYSH